MYYDKKTAALEQELRREEASLKKILDQAAEKKQKLRAVKGRILATTKSEKWHAMALTAEARRIGFTGEHAEALFHLHSLPLGDYVEAITLYAKEAPGASILSIELAAVKANLASWTELGKQQHWDRARREYEAEVERFKKWQTDSPEKTSWRNKPATKNQYFLIWRTAQQKNIDCPNYLKCGEAHDWLNKHDANLRFRDQYNETSPPKEDSSPHPKEDSSPRLKEDSSPPLKEDSSPHPKEDSSPPLNQQRSPPLKEDSSVHHNENGYSASGIQSNIQNNENFREKPNG